MGRVVGVWCPFPFDVSEGRVRRVEVRDLSCSVLGTDGRDPYRVLERTPSLSDPLNRLRCVVSRRLGCDFVSRGLRVPTRDEWSPTYLFVYS